jgi:hypothetical protein
MIFTLYEEDNNNMKTARYGRVVGNPASYSAGSGLNLGLATVYRDPRFFIIFLSRSRQIRGQYLEVDHDSFLPNPLQYTRL